MVERTPRTAAAMGLSELVRPSVDDPWRDTIHVGLVIPLQGPAGIFGPSCEASASLAVEEVNTVAVCSGGRCGWFPSTAVGLRSKWRTKWTA